jgi:hypothetical protein
MAPATAPARVLLLGTDTAGTIVGVTTGASIPVNLQAPGSLSIYLTSIGTTSGGTILIEEADYDQDKDAPYTGTWGTIQTISASTFTGGAQLPVHVVGPVAYGFIRVRISSAITGGGTITAAARYW